MAATTTCTGSSRVGSISASRSAVASTGSARVASRSGIRSTGTGTASPDGKGRPQTSQESPDAWTFSQSAQVGMGMDGLRRGGGTEQLGDRGITFLIGLFGKGQVLAIGLGFSGKGLKQVALGLASFQFRHVSLLENV